MPSGSLEVTLVSASISPYTPLEGEPCDTYATLNCINEQHRTKNARDQGRLPVWNETFNFDIQEDYMSGDLLVQVFSAKTGADELLGTARIPLFSMVGKDEATLCSLVNPGQGEIGKVKAIWKWKPGSQASFKSSSYQEGNMSGHQGSWESAGYPAYNSKVPPHEEVSGPVAYPHVLNPTNSGSESYGKLEAVNDAMAKLSMEKGSQRFAASYPEEASNFGKEERAPGGDYYSYPPVSGQYSLEHAPMPETCARGGSDYGYPPPVGAYPPSKDAYPPNKDAYPPHSSGSYPPPSKDAYPPNKDAYPPHSSGSYPPPADAYPPNIKGYHPAYPTSAYPLPESGGYPPQSGAYPPPPGSYCSNEEGYPPYPGSANPPYSDPYASSNVSSEGTGHMEKGGGVKEKGGSGKDKGKGHGSHTPYGQPPPAGYPPSSYPQPNAGYPPYGQPPGGYPPAQHGYPPAQHAYPPAPQGYPPAPHGYPPAGYLPQGYPPAHAAPGYSPHGYPASGHENHGHKPDKYGHAAGAYVGHSSSSSKPSKKHKEPKHSSSHKHSKHKKQKSFKGMKFKKFKMFKF